MPEETARTPETSKSTGTGEGKMELTPEQVKEVAEKVYALFLRDIRITRERCRFNPKSSHGQGGSV